MVIPTLRAASSTLVPGGTSTGMLSMISFGMRFLVALPLERAFLFHDMLPHLVLEVRQEPLQRRHGPRRQGTEGIGEIFYVLAQDVQIPLLSPSRLDSLQDLPDEGESLPAGGAPAARFPGEEGDQVQGRLH